jgi:ribosomal protein S18 acetylase RimI-like enzyme
LIGYAQVRWGEAPSCIAAISPGEIRRIYLVEAWQGRGLAQELLAACIDVLRQRASSAAWLGVWERNPRAISFYRKYGFVEAGEHEFRLGTDRQRDVIMVKALMPGERGWLGESG